MTAELHIPDEALEAVLRALDGDDAEPLSEQTAGDVAECRTALAAAAPVIVAAELRRIADELQVERDRAGEAAQLDRTVGLGEAVIALRARIVELTEGGAR
jgi:hypothetical protein